MPITELTRRSVLSAALGAAASAALSGPTFGQSAYPARPITLVVPFAAGGSTDVVARIVAQKMSEGLGQQVIVENVAGAGGNLGAAAVARRRGDGYNRRHLFPGGVAPGQWRPTPPDHATSGYTETRTFLFRDLDDADPVPPPALGGEDYLIGVETTRRLGALVTIYGSCHPEDLECLPYL